MKKRRKTFSLIIGGRSSSTIFRSLTLFELHFGVEIGSVKTVVTSLGVCVDLRSPPAGLISRYDEQLGLGIALFRNEFVEGTFMERS